MKNCDEMVESLMTRRSEYIKKRQQRKKILSAAVPICLCLIALAGAAIWKAPQLKENPPIAGGASESSGIFTGHYQVLDGDDAVKGEPTDSDKCTSSKETLSKPIGPSVPYIDGNDYIASSSPAIGGDIRAVLIIDGITYDQSDVATQNADDYTKGECLGDVHELEGTYKQYDIKGGGKAYRTLESPDHIMIKLLNGETIILKRQELK